MPPRHRDKRRRTAAGSKTTASVPEDGFSDVLAAAGLRFQGSGPDVLDEGVSAAAVHRAVEAHLGDDPNSPELTRFLDGLATHMESATRLRISLQAPVSAAASADHAEAVDVRQSDSLMRMLLCVDVVQIQVANLLLQKLSEFALGADTGASQMDSAAAAYPGGGGNLPKLVLNQLRWLPNVVDAKVSPFPCLPPSPRRLLCHSELPSLHCVLPRAVSWPCAHPAASHPVPTANHPLLSPPLPNARTRCDAHCCRPTGITQGLAQSMIEMASVTPEDVQREIIGTLPEVVDDRGSDEVVQQLQQLMQAEPKMTVPILDALSNLTMAADQLSEVQDEVMEALASYSADVLPVAVRFLLQGAAPKAMQTLVQQLRDRLDFDSITSAEVAGESDVADETLTLEAFRASMRFQKTWVAVDALLFLSVLQQLWLSACQGSIPRPIVALLFHCCIARATYTPASSLTRVGGRAPLGSRMLG